MYGLKYQCTFDPIGPVSATPIYVLRIFQKDYSGEVFSVKGGQTPVLQQWDTDDPKAPIKGSSLAITLINDGTLSLSDFYSSEDDTFKVRLTYILTTVFEGFIVQDDCSEPMLDSAHEISLGATDNLGLLKDVSLEDANIFSLYFTSDSGIFIGADFASRIFAIGAAVDANVGDRIEIIGTDADGTYTINKIVNPDDTIATLLYVDEAIPAGYFGTGSYKIDKPANLLDKTTLATILRMCLSVTGLDLETNVYGKIIETSQLATKSFLEQTLINPQTFLKDDNVYTDCYDVLTKILSRFNMTLFQSMGAWNIVRWDELRYYDNNIEGYKFDKDFTYLNDITMPDPLSAGKDEVIKAETGLIRKISRPFQYDKETFNYQYPRQLIRNFDLKQVGSLIRSYETGTGEDIQKVSEYQAPWYFKEGQIAAFEPGPYFIRVTTDVLENEIARVLVVDGYCRTFPIEANAGDSFKFSFSYKTQDSQAGVVTNVFFVELNDGTKKRFFHNPDLTNGDSMWQVPPGFVFQIASTDNTNQWHTVEIDCTFWQIPFDGLLYFYLTICDLSGSIHETYYKDIRIEYATRINDTTKIIGQTHQSTQTGNIKNNEDIEIFIDSSPRNAISGTLFLDEKVGVIQKKTSKWMHPYKVGQSVNLGQLITFEQMFFHRIPRTVLEGSLYNLVSGGQHISLLSVIRYSYFSKLNFVFGKLEIDYKNNKLDGTLYEIWQDDEQDSDLPSRYNFNYLYSTE